MSTTTENRLAQAQEQLNKAEELLARAQTAVQEAIGRVNYQRGYVEACKAQHAMSTPPSLVKGQSRKKAKTEPTGTEG